MNILKCLDALVVRIVNPILVLIGLAVALLLAIGIFSRAVLGKPVFGLEELMLLSAMWFYMLGAALASRERSHLSADFVQVLTSNPKIHRAASLVSTVISLGVAVMFATWAWNLFAFGLERGQTTAVFGIPWWTAQVSLLVASIAFVIYLIRDLILELSGANISPGDPSSPME
ncbi:TRAP transporter small permease [Aromatoleum evansii]|uniref:TRAP transporter small permease n=1 Tax=Aromatoleum evansii TaxID=59406 RepID=UPI00145C507F|nr:TRAP transporter small permease [Aromatoleum evansii]NMG29460.1 TRAP transporter small permease subunit [Aromatoleum evansii]